MNENIYNSRKREEEFEKREDELFKLYERGHLSSSTYKQKLNDLTQKFNKMRKEVEKEIELETAGGIALLQESY